MQSVLLGEAGRVGLSLRFDFMIILVSGQLLETAVHLKLLRLLFLLSCLIAGLHEPLSVFLRTLGRLDQFVVGGEGRAPERRYLTDLL